MYYILFNPLSKSGKRVKTIKELQKKLLKENEESVVHNLLEIEDISSFIKKLKEDDKVVFVGGDGTLHYLANFLNNEEIDIPMYVYGAGTGNDFFRNINAAKKSLPQINEHLKNLPRVDYETKSEVFINGCGFGIDGDVCYRVNKSRWDDPLTYGLNAMISFLTYKPFGMKLEADDGVVHNFKKTWLVSIMHGKYQGGGMMFAPDAIRDDEYLEVMVVHKMSRLLLLILFSSIYKGQHIKHMDKGISFFKVKKVKITADRGLLFQLDGEVREGVRNIVVER